MRYDRYLEPLFSADYESLRIRCGNVCPFVTCIYVSMVTCCVPLCSSWARIAVGSVTQHQAVWCLILTLLFLRAMWLNFSQSYDKANQMHWILKFIFGIKIYMFRTVPVSIIRNFSLYTQQRYVIQVCWQLASRMRALHPDPARKLYDMYHCCVYSEKLLMMDRGTVRNM